MDKKEFKSETGTNTEMEKLQKLNKWELLHLIWSANTEVKIINTLKTSTLCHSCKTISVKIF